MTDKIRSAFLTRLHNINFAGHNVAKRVNEEVETEAELTVDDIDVESWPDNELIEFVDSLDHEEAVEMLYEELEDVSAEELREQVRALLELSPGLLGRYASAARKQYRAVRPVYAAARASGDTSNKTVGKKTFTPAQLKNNQSKRKWGNATALRKLDLHKSGKYKGAATSEKKAAAKAPAKKKEPAAATA